MANRFFVSGGVDNNWGTSGNWSASSGGAGGETVPTASDDVFFDGSSPNCTINTSARVGLSIDFTGYTNTITFSQTLTISTHVTLAAGMTFAGASALIVTTTGTFTSNGKAVGVPLTLSGATATITLADDLTTIAALSLAPGTSATKTINGNTIHVQQDLSTSGNGTLAGSTQIVFDGTGTWSSTGSRLTYNTTVNTAGTLTISGVVRYGGGTLTYTAGTVVTTGSTLNLDNTTTLDVAGITWVNVSITGNDTHTLSAALNVTGILDLTPSNTATLTLNGSQVNLTGSASFATTGAGSGIVAGTTTIVFGGNNTWSMAGASTVAMRLPLSINTAGTLTISGTVRYNTGTITYAAGAIAQASTGTVNVTAGTATLFDFAGGDLGDVILQINTAGVILNLASELVIHADGALVCLGTAASPVGIRSDSTPTQRKLTIQTGASIDVGYCNLTDIDNSDGAVMHVFKGTLSNTDNIEQFTPYDAPFAGAAVGGLRSYGFVA